MHINRQIKKKTKYFYNKSTNVLKQQIHNSTQFMLRYNKTK